MKIARGVRRGCLALLLGLAFTWACAFSDELREYLSARFWLPFAKHSASFERPRVRRMNAPYAGMGPEKDGGPLDKLRSAYRQISPIDRYAPQGGPSPPDLPALRQAVAAARAASSSVRDKEEVDLIEAKIEMRASEPDDDELLSSANSKLQTFLRHARTPEFRSEARGWMAHIHYLLGEQTAAGKIYLDELMKTEDVQEGINAFLQKRAPVWKGK